VENVGLWQLAIIPVASWNSRFVIIKVWKTRDDQTRPKNTAKMYHSSLPPAGIGMRDIKFSRPYQEGRPSEIAHGLIVQVSTVTSPRPCIFSRFSFQFALSEPVNSGIHSVSGSLERRFWQPPSQCYITSQGRSGCLGASSGVYIPQWGWVGDIMVSWY